LHAPRGYSECWAGSRGKNADPLGKETQIPPMEMREADPHLSIAGQNTTGWIDGHQYCDLCAACTAEPFTLFSVRPSPDSGQQAKRKSPRHPGCKLIYANR